MINRSARFLISVILIQASNFFINNNANAQSNFSFAAGSGIMFYNGDLSSQSFFPPVKTIKPFVSADVSILLVDRVDLSFRYLHGNVKGGDALSKENDNLARNQDFTSKFNEVSALLRLRLFSVKSNVAFNPFIVGGYGMFWFNPQSTINGKIYDLQPLGTEGQFIGNPDYPAPYKLHSTSIYYGAGVYMRLADQWHLRVEAAPQLTFTDYLDDTSFNYPDSTELAGTPNGAIAVLFSSKRPKGFPVKGRSRGNPNRDDVVVTVGVSIVYTPGSKKNGPGAKPGVFSQFFKGRKGWWGQAPN